MLPPYPNHHHCTGCIPSFSPGKHSSHPHTHQWMGTLKSFALKRKQTAKNVQLIPELLPDIVVDGRDADEENSNYVPGHIKNRTKWDKFCIFLFLWQIKQSSAASALSSWLDGGRMKAISLFVCPYFIRGWVGGL